MKWIPVAHWPHRTITGKEAEVLAKKTFGEEPVHTKNKAFSTFFLIGQDRLYEEGLGDVSFKT